MPGDKNVYRGEFDLASSLGVVANRADDVFSQDDENFSLSRVCGLRSNLLDLDYPALINLSPTLLRFLELRRVDTSQMGSAAKA